MINDNSKNYPVEVDIVGGVIEVTDSSDGRRLISDLWRIFTTSYHVQKGDLHMDRSRGLLQRHLKWIDSEDQEIIQGSYEDVRGIRDAIEKQSGSQFQKILEARKYKHRARTMYRIVKIASARALDNHILNQINKTMCPPATEGASGTNPLTDTVSSNPFSDSHAAAVSRISVNDIEQVGISSIHDEATNEEAAVFDLIGRDQSVQRVIAFSGDRTDRASSPDAMSSHQQDDSRPGFIVVSIPDVTEERADEQAETRTLESFAPNETVTSESKRPRAHPVMRASVRPTEDPHTRFPLRRKTRKPS